MVIIVSIKGPNINGLFLLGRRDCAITYSELRTVDRAVRRTNDDFGGKAEKSYIL